MEIYKLIKWYPSLPKELEEGTEVTYYESVNAYSDEPNYSSLVELNKEEVEDNPEFWEKVFERSFVINHHNLEKVITSVTRLKDNKKFSLGDVVLLEGDTFKRYTIRNFEVFNKDLLVHFDFSVSNLKNLSYIEPVVFTSYDGEELTEKDEYYVVTDKFNFSMGGSPVQWPSFSKDKVTYKRFAKKENAEEYITENNPCLSYKDIDGILDSYLVNRTVQMQKVKEFVKNRLDV